MRKKIGLVFLAFLVAFYSNAQLWYEMIQNGERDFRKIQKSAEEYFKRIDISQRGTGYNWYKRWEYNTLQSLGEDSLIPQVDIATIWSEYRRSNPHNTETSAGNWEPLGPVSWTVMNNGYSPGLGRVNYIYIDTARNNTMYLCTPSGGLWRSYDGGTTYTVLTDTLASIGCGMIVVNPLDSNVLYLTTGDNFGSDTYSIGILKSTDYGQSWQPTGLTFTQAQMVRIFRLIMHPQDTATLLASTSQGLYRTTNGGQTWTLVNSIQARSLVYNPQNPNTVFAAFRHVIRSHDFGQTWTTITDTIPPQSAISRIEVAISPSDTNIVYLLMGNADNGFLNVSRSTNGGQTFQVRATSPNILHSSEQGTGTGGQAWYDLAIAVDPTNPDIIYTGGVNIWKSTNGGSSFSINSHWVYTNQNVPYVHADIHFLGFYNGALYAGCDGGIFRTTNGGQSWTDLSFGLNITQIYRLGTSHTHPQIIHFGSQDNGSMRRFPGGSWRQAFGADGMEAVIDYTTPAIAVISFQNGGLLLTMDGGNSFTTFMNGVNQPSGWITPFVIHPTDPQRWLVGRRSVWETYDRGMSWDTISPSGNVNIGALAWSKSNPFIIYFSRGNNLWKTTNGGGNWTLVSQSLPFQNISSIAIHPNNPDHVVITYSSFAANTKVFRTLDGGATWTNISQNLPNLQAWTVIFQEHNPLNAMYLGMGIGVYYRDSTMNQWEPYFEGLPNVPVRELEINYNNGKLYAATYGRGIWMSDLKWFNFSVDDQKKPTFLDVYPNPFTDVLNVRTNSTGVLELFDISGRKLFESRVEEALTTLRPGQLTSGMYLLKFTDRSGKVEVKKVVAR
ncbi:MAG: VPS10 domain-containing protein [Thermaurantimonas sp.]|uniref:VPS10 domain-containing protein n=1 Tax=Thermaurantimonas sp. TaxID=2681568 RepID=UPI00391AF6A6